MFLRIFYAKEHSSLCNLFDSVRSMLSRGNDPRISIGRNVLSDIVEHLNVNKLGRHEFTILVIIEESDHIRHFHDIGENERAAR